MKVNGTSYQIILRLTRKIKIANKAVQLYGRQLTTVHRVQLLVSTLNFAVILFTLCRWSHIIAATALELAETFSALVLVVWCNDN